MTLQNEKYVILSFDVESDIGSWTQDYTSLDNALPAISEALRKKNVPGTFFFTAKAASKRPDMLRKVLGDGHEIGSHGYQHESLGDQGYFIPGDRAILAEEIPLRLAKADKIISEVAGVKPVSFRAPRLWGGQALIETLGTLGYQVDSSYAIACAGDSLLPYHPDVTNWSKPGKSPVLEIPVPGAFGRIFDRLNPSIKACYRNYFGPTAVMPQWPLLRLCGPEAFAEYLMVFAQEQMSHAGTAVVTAFFHPWEFMSIPSVLQGSEATVTLARYIHENCNHKQIDALCMVVDLLASAGFSFVTHHQCHKRWTGEES
jgi:peptidoglycan-N-acetylglucosamine deacetylase